MLKAVQFVDAVSRATGWCATWCVLLACVVCAGNAILRYALGMQGPLAQFSRGGLVKEFVGNMVSQFGANLDRQLAGLESAAPATVSAGGVLWRWLLNTFFNRGGAK